MSESQDISSQLDKLVQPDGQGVSVAIKVVPNASRVRLAGFLGDRLKVAVAAPPEDGKANAAVCKLLAKAMGVPDRQVNVKAGHSQPMKTLHVQGLDKRQAVASLAQAMQR